MSTAPKKSKNPAPPQQPTPPGPNPQVAALADLERRLARQDASVVSNSELRLRVMAKARA
jgi:hypothetical protein